MRILGVCSYKGTNYYGWQKQVGFVSVESTIEECLSKVYNSEINIIGSGRTDAGVHAFRQYFHYDTDKEKDLNQLMYSLNRMLPEDIKIISLEVVNDDFHARYSAKKKIYKYRIVLTNKDPLLYDQAYIYPMDFDFALFAQALKKFEGIHTFKDFTSKEEDEDGFVRTIYSIEVKQEKDSVSIDLKGNGFMLYMIRDIIGTCLAIASGKEDISYITKHLDSANREIVSYKAGSEGLYLIDVIY